jgi:hypothetical protein
MGWGERKSDFLRIVTLEANPDLRLPHSCGPVEEFVSWLTSVGTSYALSDTLIWLRQIVQTLDRTCREAGRLLYSRIACLCQIPR